MLISTYILKIHKYVRYTPFEVFANIEQQAAFQFQVIPMCTSVRTFLAMNCIYTHQRVSIQLTADMATVSHVPAFQVFLLPFIDVSCWIQQITLAFATCTHGWFYQAFKSCFMFCNVQILVVWYRIILPKFHGDYKKHYKDPFLPISIMRYHSGFERCHLRSDDHACTVELGSIVYSPSLELTQPLKINSRKMNVLLMDFFSLRKSMLGRLYTCLSFFGYLAYFQGLSLVLWSVVQIGSTMIYPLHSNSGK